MLIIPNFFAIHDAVIIVCARSRIAIAGFAVRRLARAAHPFHRLLRNERHLGRLAIDARARDLPRRLVEAAGFG
jgi:hypothetical protein